MYLLQNKDNIDALKNKLTAIATQFPFPAKLFKNDEWKCIFLESFTIFNESEFNYFKELLLNLNEPVFYILPESYQSIEMKNKSNEASKNLTNEERSSILKIPSDIDFEEFDKLQKELNLYFGNHIIIGDLNNWCIYSIMDLDLLILGFDSKHFTIIKNVYGKSPDLIGNKFLLLKYLKGNIKLNENILASILDENYNITSLDEPN